MTDEDYGSEFYLEDNNSSSNSKELSIDTTTPPVFLSAIKEWRIEFRSVMFIISIRTDMSWYRLGKPSEQYAAWLKPVLKTARLAIYIITLLKTQSRASCLPFKDVIKKVSLFDKTDPGHVSSELAAVQRYIIVHGRIISQLFSEYPDIAIRECAFVRTLRKNMKEKHQKSINKIAIASKRKAIVSKRKAMRATTTKLINRIWQQYCSNHIIESEEEKNVLNSSENEALKVEVCVGQTVVVKKTDSCICFVDYIFQSSDNRKLAHGRRLLRGFQTILGDTVSERELFLTSECIEFELGDGIEILDVEISQRPEKLMKYFCRSLYWPERGAFFCLPTTTVVAPGNCSSCKMKQASSGTRLFKLSTSTPAARFTYKGIEYSIRDFLYLRPANEKPKKTFKNSRNVGLKSYIVCQLLGLESDRSVELADPESVMIKVRRFFKPEDFSSDKAFFSDVREVYYSEQIAKVPVTAIEGKCYVRNKQDFQFTDCHNSLYVFEHVFFCQHLYDTQTRTLNQLPCNVELGLSSKERIVRNDLIINEQVKPLATLDIFSGCGGLSAGLKQSGVSVSTWAIEYEEPVAEAFKLNHSEAVTITSNCNAILRAIMVASGDGDECISSSEASELASKLDDKVINSLPRPGEVEFIVGGPPCQGFSGLNRFQESSWSRTQCEMILSFLSYVDYFRPKFVLLENVRNFVSFDKGKMFRLTLASLLEMGYQPRNIMNGRAYWEGNFPTTITDPTPGGKVGMCFHPEQDRIISVRECARSQGFPDSYKFSGSIKHKHRQVGNAVPPPLAFALGRKLREAIYNNLYHNNQSICTLP